MFFILAMASLKTSQMTAFSLPVASKGVAMIQFFINSRPVPRAVARHHLEQGNPSRTSAQLSGIMSKAVAKDAEAVHFLAVYGVHVERGQP